MQYGAILGKHRVDGFPTLIVVL